MKVCRVCLTMDVKMYHMLEHNLSVMYEQISGLKVNIEDNLLPEMLCWECVARLSSAHKFMKKALKTHFILVEKIKSSRFITMDDLELIHKTQLKSTLGVKLYKDNYSYSHIVKESDNCYEDCGADISEPNYVNINDGEEQLFVITDVVSAEKVPIKREYPDDNEEQISEYENNIEAGIINESIEIKTEMIEISVTEDVSDEEMVLDNESNNSGMFEEKNHIKIETTEVYDPIKQNRKRKRSEALPHCKEPRVVLEDIMLSSNEHKTQDNSQSAIDNDGTFFQGTINDNILFIEDNKSSLRNDMHTNNSVFTCNYCTFETSVKSRLTYHTHTRHLNRSFNCAHCDFVTNVKSRLIGHINAKHTRNIAFNCSYCSFNTYFKINLDRHINSKHTKNKVFNCSYCTYKTYVKYKLNAHINAKHTKVKVFKCSFCSYEAYNKNSLTKHVNLKHTETEVYACTFCSFKSCHPYNLNVHVNARHTKNLSFNCSLCNYKTYNKDLLKGHINTQHTKTEVFKCSFCNYETYDKRHLKVHINAKHTKVKAFACSYCSFKSFHKSNLNVHVNTKHTKANVFQCTFCNYKVYNKMHLKRHINTNHTKVNVFICSYCNLRVYYKSTLIRHIKTKHS